ncbi:hypothetical protein VQY72_002097 [Salmonella enterica]|nr:hypothetical protein [Salmonella enterica]EMD3084718.1 hypothetical protein [Salmonella enterica]
MAKLLSSACTWLKKPSRNKKIKFIAVLSLVAIVCFQAGEQFKFYSLSKEPDAALIELAFKKCLRGVIVTRDIHDEWAVSYYTCLSEELSHIRDKTFKTEMYIKTAKYLYECDIEKADKRKCQVEIESAYRKRLEKYHAFEESMN